MNITRQTPVVLGLCIFSVLRAQAAPPVFEPPVVVDPQLVGVGRFALDHVAATTGTGTWVAAWSNAREIVFSRSTDHGLSFSPAAILNTDFADDQDPWFDTFFEQRDNAPALAADPNGRFIAVWQRSSLQGDHIEVAHSDDSGATWTPPAILVDNGGRSPGIATDGQGKWIIVWPGHHVAGGKYQEVYFTRSTDGGNTWSAPAPLVANSSGGAPSVLGTRVVWSGGTWIVAWSNGDTSSDVDSDLVTSRSTDGGLTWSAPSPVDAIDANRDFGAQLAGDGAGNWIAVWEARLANSQDVLAARSSDDAVTWSAPVALNADPGTGSSVNWAIHAAAGATGEFVAAWTRYSEEAGDPYGNDDADVLMRSTSDGGVSWTPELPLNAADTDGMYEDEIFPFVAHDPSGHWMVFWSSEDDRLLSGTKGGYLDLVYALAGHPCGNGVTDPGEGCDDGRRGDLDCCDRTCTFNADGTACAADDDLCTLERCDGSGTCNHLTAPAGTLCTADSDVCTYDRCDDARNCEHVAEPRPSCKQPFPGSSKLQIVDGADPADRSFRWKWSRGDLADLYDVGQSVQDFGLCVFDSNGLIARFDAPAGPRCLGDVTEDCWKFAGNRSWKYQYRNKSGSPTGLTSLVLKGNDVSRFGISLSASGDNLVLPSLPLTNLPLRVQLVNEIGTCWDTVYSQPKETTDTSFKASND